MRDVELLLATLKQVEIFAGVTAGLRRLKKRGFKIFVITNQSGIGRGYFAEAEYRAVEREVQRQIGARFDRRRVIFVRMRRKPDRSAGSLPRRWSSKRSGNIELDSPARSSSATKRSTRNAGAMPACEPLSFELASNRHECDCRPIGSCATSPRQLRPSCAMPFKALGVIPARWGSTRFPGKPLHPIAGKPLLQHVWERCQRAKNLDAVIIATDDMRIAGGGFRLGSRGGLDLRQTSQRNRPRRGGRAESDRGSVTFSTSKAMSR